MKRQPPSASRAAVPLDIGRADGEAADIDARQALAAARRIERRVQPRGRGRRRRTRHSAPRRRAASKHESELRRRRRSGRFAPAERRKRQHARRQNRAPPAPAPAPLPAPNRSARSRPCPRPHRQEIEAERPPRGADRAAVLTVARSAFGGIIGKIPLHHERQLSRPASAAVPSRRSALRSTLRRKSPPLTIAPERGIGE